MKCRINAISCACQINLSSGNISHRELAHIIAAITKRKKILRQLDLSDNPLFAAPATNANSKKQRFPVFELLARLMHLPIEEIDLGSTEIFSLGPPGYEFHQSVERKRAFHDAFQPYVMSKACISVQRLDLSHNNLSDDQCRTLSVLLKGKYNCLAVLELRCNWISNKGSSHLARGLKLNKTLKKLNLSGNNLITQDGWAEFAPLIGDTTSIQTTQRANHTLMVLYHRYPARAVYNDMDGPNELKELLNVNFEAWRLAKQLDRKQYSAQSIASAAKIIKMHIAPPYGRETRSPPSFAHCVIPDLLGWMGKYHFKETRSKIGNDCLTAFYSTIQNNAWLFAANASTFSEQAIPETEPLCLRGGGRDPSQRKRKLSTRKQVRQQAEEVRQKLKRAKHDEEGLEPMLARQA
jgi:hypothetical protein